MTYFADLSRYSYSKSIIPDRNIGWLGRWHKFPRGNVSAGFINGLALQVAVPRNRARGYHSCPYCGIFGKGAKPVSIRVEGVEVHLGGAEIHAFSRAGEVFSAPDLIYHYVEKHGYRPPDEFIQAVIDGVEGRVGESMIRQVRAVLEQSPRVEDRLDAAADLMMIAPRSVASWIDEAINSPSVDQYFKQKLSSLRSHISSL
jgi:hypothetical protein